MVAAPRFRESDLTPAMDNHFVTLLPVIEEDGVASRFGLSDPDVRFYLALSVSSAAG